jgi:protein tyrosine/serine phosphatase
MIARFRRNFLRAGLFGLAILATPVGAYAGYLVYTGNLHAVANGVVYRSAELSKDEFATAIHDYKLRSILNLRGAHPGEAWYDDEIAASRAAGIDHYDYPMSAKRLVRQSQIEAVLKLVRNAPKPLLIHCRSGSDRSGLVAALFRFAVQHASAADADRQLSLLYGHFPYLTSKTSAMDKSFWAFVRESEDKPPGR